MVYQHNYMDTEYGRKIRLNNESAGSALWCWRHTELLPSWYSAGCWELMNPPEQSTKRRRCTETAQGSMGSVTHKQQPCQASI